MQTDVLISTLYINSIIQHLTELCYWSFISLIKLTWILISLERKPSKLEKHQWQKLEVSLLHLKVSSCQCFPCMYRSLTQRVSDANRMFNKIVIWWNKSAATYVSEERFFVWIHIDKNTKQEKVRFHFLHCAKIRPQKHYCWICFLKGELKGLSPTYGLY